MMNSLKQLAFVMQVAEELYDEGKIQKDDYLKLVESVELDYRNSSDFLKELKDWVKDLLTTDKATNHEGNLDNLLAAFLHSPDANDAERRIEVLQMVKLFKNLLSTIDGYNEKLMLKQLSRV